jgi:hypothetical protein
MENTFHLIPSSKRDWDAVHHLQAASAEQIIALADDLLPWLQDMNWPIADYIQALLVPHVEAISDNIVRVLNESDDDVWKSWLLSELVAEIPAAQLSFAMQEALRRIVEHPTAGEQEYVLDKARSVLELDE